ncbi:MAG TPA: hypothetical protein VHM65_00135, partial [Candidatus Lustribacter sp.]|nr:hypothetical protein [Candidatus Lustribacter sp.]
SALALLVCGLLLASVAMLVQRRQVRLVLVLAVGLGLVVAAAGPFLAGGTLGSHPQLLANLGRLPLFRMVNGALPDTGTLVPAGFFGPGGQGIAFLVLLLSLQLVQAAKVMVWLPAVAALPRVRQDPMSWVLAGMALGGLGAVLTLFHPGGSALYFMYGALPFGSVLGAWLAAEALDEVGPDRSRVLARRSLLAGAGLSLLGAAVIWRLPVPSTGHGMTTLSAVTMGVLVVLCLVIAAWVWRRGGFRDPARRQQSIGALAAGLVGAMVVSGPLLAVASPPSPRTPGASAKTGSVKPASPPPVSWVDRMRVGEYADSHLPDDALLATNAHCTEYAMPTGCRAAQFWVSGFTLRQVLVSGWAYSTAANKDQTFTQPEALAKNDAFFSAPSRSGLDYLRSQGVTYVVASLSNGPVSPAIASYADMVMRTPTVWLLKLKS